MSLGPARLAIDVVGQASVTREGETLALRGVLAPTSPDPTLELRVRHDLGELVHVWVPHLTPSPGNVAGDAVFRAPTVILANEAIALAFVPDLDDVAAAHGTGWRAWLDYDHPAGVVTLAAGDYRPEGHVFYRRCPPAGTGAEVLLRLHVLSSERPEDRANPYGMVARWLWDRWGARPPTRSLAAPPQRLEPLLAHVVRWAFTDEGWGESVWQTVPLDGQRTAGAPVFIVDVTRHPSVPPAERQWREARSIWNQAWFSTQRCANGLLRYARQVGSADLEARARSMTEIALAAPEDDGLFPAVLIAEDSGAWRWSNSDRRPPSASGSAVHLVDAAFTGLMLLEWHELSGEPRARGKAERLADRLLRLQRPGGGFPGWVEPTGAWAVPELADGPESAVLASLLFALGRTAPALRATALLDEVAREGRWEDFETYYSCAPWGAERIGRRVERNGVFKQNTLSIAWSAEAFLRAWRATRDQRWLDLARRALDELCLYQAVWDPPFLPAPAHGGFGVMNADSEWNDARQSLFALLLLDAGRELADPRLVARGVAAVRASFSMLYCPENAALARAYEARFPFFGPETYGFMMENQGHGTADADRIGTFTIYTWGNGSALATAAAVRDRFPEVAEACGLA
jgi:hypothetical protein